MCQPCVVEGGKRITLCCSFLAMRRLWTAVVVSKGQQYFLGETSKARKVTFIPNPFRWLGSGPIKKNGGKTYIVSVGDNDCAKTFTPAEPMHGKGE